MIYHKDGFIFRLEWDEKRGYPGYGTKHERE